MKQIRLVVASPSDVTPERNAVTKVVDDLNKLLGRQNDFTIEVWRWETDSGPGFHPLGPQGSIDADLKIADCDILLAIFWTRFGTRILRGRETGTEHEINLAFKAWKSKKKPQILVYFKTALVDPSSIDTGQLERVKAFRNEFNPKGKYKHGTYETFTTEDDFKDKLRVQLARHLPTASNAPPPTAASGFDFEGYRAQFGVAPKWDLSNIGVAQAPGDAPVSPTLDRIYQQLRIADEATAKSDAGAPLLPDEVAALNESIVLLGPAGAGKTTWIRNVFFELLKRPGVCPFLIELRKVAGTFERLASAGKARSLISYLAATLQEMDCIPHGLEEALKDTAGPRPILLVDGWDELGELGGEFRQKLTGFIRSHPRVGAVVTSRPYGLEKPDRSDGFVSHYIQPLNDAEIADFSDRFWEVCYVNDPKHAEFARRFKEALQASASAKALASNPLLCTMMLFISRSRTLPDERHDLYETCINHSLSAYRREELRVPGMPHHWCPEKLNARLRAVAALAFAIHRREGDQGRTALLPSREMAKLLPKSCDGHREGFLAWLAGPAGLPSDRSDGSLSFAHLSFQEYLTAWHIANVLDEGEQPFEKWAEDAKFPEVLRLWGAVAWAGRRERFMQVAERLRRTDDGTCALGGMLADGWGSETLFNDWLDQILGLIRRQEPLLSADCGRAWAGSRQRKRKHLFEQRWNKAVTEWNWIERMRAGRWSSRSGFKLPPPNPIADAVHKAVAPGAKSTSQSCALGRVWKLIMPARETTPMEWALCEVWPSLRRMLGARVETVLSLLGDDRWPNEIAQEALPRIRKAKSRNPKQLLSQDWMPPRLIELIVEERQIEQLRTAFTDGIREWARYQMSFGGDAPADFHRIIEGGRNLLVAFDRGAYQFGNPWPEETAEGLLLESLSSEQTASASADLLGMLRLVTGGGSARSQLAWSCYWEEPEAKLISTACRESLHPGDHTKELKDAIQGYSGDPLWPALARHLTRQASQADRDLLLDLATHPEKREPPLRWGLQYIVRGDIMMPDFSVRPLEDLLAKYGLPTLPHLEEMPDEIELIIPKAARKRRRSRDRN